MPTYLEYDLGNNTAVLVRVQDRENTGWAKAGSSRDGNLVIRVGKGFNDALAGVKAQATTLRRNLEELRADEVEVKFSLTATGELGNFAIGQIGVEANYEVTLKWTNKKSGVINS